MVFAYHIEVNVKPIEVIDLDQFVENSLKSNEVEESLSKV